MWAIKRTTARLLINNDATLTAALLDRLLHHVETIVIEGRSYRTKDQINPI